MVKSDCGILSNERKNDDKKNRKKEIFANKDVCEKIIKSNCPNAGSIHDAFGEEEDLRKE